MAENAVEALGNKVVTVRHLNSYTKINAQVEGEKGVMGKNVKQEVTLQEVLDFREHKVEKMNKYRAKYPDCMMISLGMNIPGPYKTGNRIYVAFTDGIQAIQYRMKEKGVAIRKFAEIKENAGYLGIFVLETKDAMEIKKMMVALEEHHRYGRLYDIDVYTVDGQGVSRDDIGMEGRKCLICGEDAKACGSRRVHTWQELREVVDQILEA